jgi:hypothetical protein
VRSPLVLPVQPVQQVCAGCGLNITETTRGVWAHTEGKARILVCEMAEMDGVLLWARYHYVQGEEQRVWQGIS